MASAISKDEGESWEGFRNIESYVPKYSMASFSLSDMRRDLLSEFAEKDLEDIIVETDNERLREEAISLHESHASRERLIRIRRKAEKVAQRGNGKK